MYYQDRSEPLVPQNGNCVRSEYKQLPAIYSGDQINAGFIRETD